MSMTDLPFADDVRRWRLRRFRVRFLKLILALFIVGGLYFVIKPFAYFAWKLTDSVDGHLFLVVTVMPPEKGELEAFWPPANRYYPKQLWWTKYVVGEPGDVISHKGREVFINGRSYGVAAETARVDGRRLEMVGDGAIPPGFLFMWTPHPRSYDSRYADIGLIPYEKTIGRSFRLF